MEPFHQQLARIAFDAGDVLCTAGGESRATGVEPDWDAYLDG